MTLTHPAIKAVPLAEVPKEKLKILVIDDHKGIADSTRQILEHAGYECQVAYDAESAISLAEDFQPDLLISDVIMDGRDGIETTLDIRNRMGECAVILLSGEVLRAQTIMERAQLNAPLLAKPLAPQDLCEQVGIALYHKHASFKVPAQR